MKVSKSYYIRKTFFLIIGVFLFFWVYEFFAGPESFTFIVDHKQDLIFLVLINIPTIFFDAWSWKILMKKNQVSLLWCFLITWIAQSSNKFLPAGNISGEFVRIYLGMKKGMSASQASSTVIADLALATFSLLLMAIFSLFFLIISDSKFSLFTNGNKFILFSPSSFINWLDRIIPLW